MERKIIEAPRLSLKADDGATDAGLITGYGSTWDNVDSQNERVMRGAFSDTLEGFVQDGFIAVGHDWYGMPVASVKSATEDDTGLLLTGEFHTNQDAQKARTVVRERIDRGKSVKLSIGYDVIEDRKAEDKVRELVKLKLYEVSIVTVPANPAANVTDAKGKIAAGSLDGLRLNEHSEAVRATVDGWIKRLDDLYVLRTKESRTLSRASLSDIDAAIESISTALKTLKSLKERATVPKDEAEKQILREFRRLKLKREAHYANAHHGCAGG